MRYPEKLKKKIENNRELLIKEFGSDTYERWLKERPHLKELAKLESVLNKESAK